MKVRQFIDKERLLMGEEHVLVGVSGGADSMMLLSMLMALQKEKELKITVVTVDHMLRGEESYQDLEFVRAYCEQHGISFVGKQVNVKHALTAQKGSLQQVARDMRYGAFLETLKAVKATVLALGQHGDDQVETVLMGLTRGGTSKGYGIPITRDFHGYPLIRPLLPLTKDDIYSFVQHHRIPYREDPSNQKEDYTRNRFRLHTLPFLKSENPKVHEHFLRFSKEQREDDDYLWELTSLNVKKCTYFGENRVELQIDAYRSMPLPLQRRGIHLILNYLYQHKPLTLSAIHIDDVLDLISKPHPSGSLDFPRKLTVEKSYNCLIFSFSSTTKRIDDERELGVGETISLTDGKVLSLAITEGVKQSGVYLKPEEISLPLVIRSRKPGDRMQVKGLNGSKKVKDIFIDEKVPISLRNTWPLIFDQTGKLLWIPGIRKSVNIYDSPTSKKDLHLLYQ
ncbi:hypothetical protein Q73_16060 [Bacillus coahuilensis m2-6]|uniref:tRNA(Ile)-lysidine synthase n=2 Tax=Bacillus coahuilensis TaxID=408580 RepID=A0A147K500_9BACI|nr:hypothetical protein Q73_16060 [Bacillus coahuilensis m2-6]KUP04584.1 hypothetical protein Q75_15045 [Bacillus coahuilensis p1.1.43]